MTTTILAAYKMSVKASQRLKNKPKLSSPAGFGLKKKGSTDYGVPRIEWTSSPTVAETGQEKGDVDAVLDNEEVALLLFKEDELLYAPKPYLTPPWHKYPRKVLVRNSKVVSPSQEEEGRRQMEKEVEDGDKQQYKRVGVLYPMPSGTTFPASGLHALSRFDKDKNFVGQTILGSAEEFSKELKNQKLIGSTRVFTHAPPIVKLKVPTPPHLSDMPYKKTTLTRDRYALCHWEKSMAMRKTQQKILAGKLKRSPAELAMATGDNYRKVQEERDLIDRAIPYMDYGKGYRKGSEFWAQRERLGDEEKGINITLTKSQQGRSPTMVFVGVPRTVQKEMGMSWERGAKRLTISRTWDRSQYLCKRQRDLKGTPAEAKSFRPDFSVLEVVGRVPGGGEDSDLGTAMDLKQDSRSVSIPSSCLIFQADSLDSLAGSNIEGEEMDVCARALLDADRDNYKATQRDSQEYIGPSIRLGSILLQWTGPPLLSSTIPEVNDDRRASQSVHSFLAIPKQNQSLKKTSSSMIELQGSWATVGEKRVAMEPLDFRMLLEGVAGSIITSTLHMENCGTTVVYFSWNPLPRKNLLGTVQAGDTQRFYFDTTGGVLLPDEKRTFPFLFKSCNTGIFLERWQLTTVPVLNEGQPLIITLKGLAYQDDIYKHQREEIERQLTKREVLDASEWILRRIVDNIRTPPHSPQEEETFKANNPSVYYHYDIVQQLKTLHLATLCPNVVDVEPPTEIKPTHLAKKIDDKSGWGTSKKGVMNKEKKLMKTKGEKEQCSAVHVSVDLPKWNLSLDTLQEVITEVEDEISRSSKLKTLNELLSQLSFPPVPLMRISPYQLCYQSLCGAMDSLASTSTHLCHVMGLPLREWMDTGGVAIDMRKTGSEMDDLGRLPSSMPQSPTGGARARRGTIKDKKDLRKFSKAVDRERVSLGNNKSRRLKASLKGASELPVATVTTAEVDPALEMKYRQNLSTAVNNILGSVIEQMTLLMNNDESI